MTGNPQTTGHPDFGRNPDSNPTSPLWDPGEAANHDLLGGGSQSRAGRWYWATGWEGGVSSEVFLNGASSVVSAANGTWQGNYVLNIITTAVSGNGAGFSKYFVALNSPGGKWGFEAMLAVNQLDCDFDIFMTDQNLTASYIGGLRLHYASTTAAFKLQYLNSSGVWTDIPGGNLGAAFAQAHSYVYHNVKLVCDFRLHQYVRVIIDAVVYDLSGIAMDTLGPGAESLQLVQTTLTTNSSVIATAEIDNVILSADEP